MPALLDPGTILHCQWLGGKALLLKNNILLKKNVHALELLVTLLLQSHL